MKYSPGEIATLLKQSTENIRLWSIEFAQHLSKSAVPEKRGKHRSYDLDDVSVLALVADYTNRNIPFEQIHKSLADGERLTPNIAPAGVGQQSKELALQKRVDDLEMELASLRAADAQNQLLKQQLADAQAALRDAYIEIGQLRGKP